MTAEIEDIPVTREAPVLEVRDLKTEITAVLIAQTGGFGESIAEGIVEIWGVIAIEGD